VLLKFEPLFDGTLGDWKLPPVSFELKEGMKPYHGRLYHIPHKHKAVSMKKSNGCATLECWNDNHHHDGLRRHLSYPKRIAQCVLYQILGNSISA
jgi:hypothetical protein